MYKRYHFKDNDRYTLHNRGELPDILGARPCVQLRVYSPVGGSPIK